MPTLTAGASLADHVHASFPEHVVRRRVLRGWGLSAREIDGQLAAGRWRQFGQAVVLHSGCVTDRQRRSVALANVGARARLTAFSGLTEHGLKGWERDAVHVLVPAGARLNPVAEFVVVTHQVDDWTRVETTSDHRRDSVVHASALAAESFPDARSGMGLLAAVVQQRLQHAAALRDALEQRPRHRHRRLLLAALDDIAMGAEALSEISFAVLCRELALPEPVRQAVRTDRHGRKRYLDVEWRLGGGRRVVVEVDGALHMQADRWSDDMFRQNDVVLDRSSVVLRFSSMAVRTRDHRVADQLRRALR